MDRFRNTLILGYTLMTFILLLEPIFLCSSEAPQNVICEIGSIERSLRPQEPKLPYPYDEEEVYFKNASDGVILSGTLTLPRMPAPFPVVILLHGSAPFDRDYSGHGHKFFLVWADHLTKQGIAVLRFDKRSAGKSTGNYNTATLEDFANDALAGVEYLKTRKEINAKQIGLIGHSEGGMTAALGASKSNDIAFIILMAAPCLNGEEIIDIQEPSLQRADGISEEIIAKNKMLRKEIFSLLKEEKNQEFAEHKLREIFIKHLNKLTPSQRLLAEIPYGQMDAQIQFYNSTWFRYWLTYDPVIALKQIRIPVLALNGELDFVVSSKQNLNRIDQVFTEIGHEDYACVELAKLNHAFQTCQTGSILEYANIEETTSPLALKMMSEWILQRTTPINRLGMPKEK